jgi:DNA-binding Xre family transcriptional regulator
MDVSYQPLFNKLVEKKIMPKQLISDGVISEETMLCIMKGERIPLEDQGKICSYLGCNVYEILKYRD